MIKGYKIIHFWCIVFVLLFCVNVPKMYAEEEKKTVRVAYFSMGDYYLTDEDGEVKSYDRQYLNKISEYTGYKFEYIDCQTWDKALDMLENHEVDLVGTMQYSKQRAEAYSIAGRKYGVTFATISTLREDIKYDDYEKMSKGSIGCVRNYVKEAELREFMKQNNITGEIVYYDTQSEMLDAARQGKIDMVACSFHTLENDWKIIAKFSYEPYFFATWKGNEKLIRDIDEANIMMELYDSDYMDELVNKFFPGLIMDPLTKNEYNYIDRKKKISVYLKADTEPIAWYDEYGQIEGMLPDILSQITRHTGLEFEIDNTAGHALNDQLTVVWGRMDNSDKDIYCTDSVLDCMYRLYHKVGDEFYKYGRYTIAVCDYKTTFTDYLNENYPNCNIIQCEYPVECLKLLKNGKADLAFVDYYVANTYLIRHNYSDIVEVPTSQIDFKLRFRYEGKDADIINSIINKGLVTISDQEFQNIQLKYALEISPDVTMNYIFHNNLGIVLCLLITVFIMLLIVVIVAVRSRMIRKHHIELTKANRALEKANRAKSDFLSQVSHDIRTPMNGIIGMAALAYEEDDINMIRRYLEQIQTSSDFMLGLLNNILDMSKIESDIIILSNELYPYNEFTAYLDAVVQPLFDKKNINFIKEIEVYDGVVLVIDKLRFNQIFFNLLSNAAKFTNEGGCVRMRITEDGRTENKIKLTACISDNGIGMSEEFQKHIFEKFSQENNILDKNTEFQGTGLGMAIVRNMIDLMGGNIEVHSKLGEGSEFIISLECDMIYKNSDEYRRYEEQQHDKSSIEKYRFDGRRVLICEDNSINMTIFCMLLEKAGIDTDCAENGAIGLEMYSNSPEGYYDAVLMDVRMPVMNGIEATQRIRSLDRKDSSDVVIIAMTANIFEEDKKVTKEAGMNAHLSKPVKPETLYYTLSQFLT